MADRSGRGPMARGVVVVAALAVLATGCALNARPVPMAPTPDASSPERPCTVAAVRSCALPYPSDEFTVADALSATGRRVQMPEGVVPRRITDRLGPGATQEDAFRDADGFSALTPIMFEVERPVRPGSLPADGGDVLALFDLDTGERVPIRADVPADAARHGAPDTIVVAWPRVRLEFGHRYVARLTNGIRAASGGPLTRTPGLSTDHEYARSLRAGLAEVEGDRWDQIVSATRFTVRSEENATAEIDRMAAIARAEDHPLRKVRVQPPLLVKNASAVVTGEVLLSDFRDEDGVARVANGSTPRWERFLMVLPQSPAGEDGAPVGIYGHGLTVAKETMFGVASANAKLGIATIGIDVPNHGDRQGSADRGYLLDLSNPRRFGRLASMPLQGIVDHVSLLMAVQDHLGDLELELPALPGQARVAAPRLDTSRILYAGTSMGGVLGASFSALAPELDGSFLQVAGTGIADIIYNSLLWPLFMPVLPSGASTGDAYALMGVATMLLDPADNANLVERTRRNGNPVFLTYGMGDGIVSNGASERLVHLLDLPLVGPQLRPLEHGRFPSISERPEADGWGVAQIASSFPADLRSFGAHVSFAEPRSERVLVQWLEGRLRSMGLDPG